MNILIVGAGRMGVRHAIGAAQIAETDAICMCDIRMESLESAKEQLEQDEKVDVNKFTFVTVDDLQSQSQSFDLGIIASTVNDRMEVCRLAIQKGCNDLLVEKPLGQNMAEVKTVIGLIEDSGVNAAVNLNTRLYESFISLKDDLRTLPQLQGEKVITLNTGAIGIGANGIHYMDLLYFLLDADRAELVAGEIEEQTIESGRGPKFEDYGGWCAIKYYGKDNQYLGIAHLSMTATSTVFGGWDIVAQHGRIRINELEQERVDILRKEDSELPMYRYAGDYLPPQKSEFTSPFLGDLTNDWINGILNGTQILPSLAESEKVHELLFEWLALNAEQKKHFSFT